ncbi:MAG TPA: GNAT family N-acetyltransferase, partial [Gammaproteobacteria bacterium]|nr:GNAT family N-acetyltransferase [Gammaproteobacteria bacterium]
EPTDVAEEVIAVSQKTQKPVLAAFVGGAHVKPAKDLFTQYQALHYDMPEKAVKSFSYLASFQSNQQLLLQVPEPFSLEPKPNIMLAKSVTEKALAENRAALTPNECKTILQAFGIPVTQAKQMFSNLRDRELMIGVTRDPIFGPVISLGAGGTLVELMKDRVYTLPPLNSFIARQLIQQTHITKLSDIDMDKILNILLRVSEMICEMPMIKEIEMNPLIIKKNSAEVFDVKIIIDEKFKPIQRYSHMAIHPYPNQLMTHHNISENFSIMIRPIKPEDAIITQAFMRDLSPHSKYFRFMQHIRELTPAMLVRLTQIDYDREMTFIATIDENGKEIAIGLAHYVTNPDRESSEFAIVIADAWQNKGIGSKLMNALTQEAKAQHLSVMMGFVIATNTSMLELTKRLGFVVSNSDDPTVKIVTRYL